mgnify:CR=1 FL=1
MTDTTQTGENVNETGGQAEGWRARFSRWGQSYSRGFDNLMQRCPERINRFFGRSKQTDEDFRRWQEQFNQDMDLMGSPVSLNPEVFKTWNPSMSIGNHIFQTALSPLLLLSPRTMSTNYGTFGGGDFVSTGLGRLGQSGLWLAGTATLATGGLAAGPMAVAAGLFGATAILNRSISKKQTSEYQDERIGKELEKINRQMAGASQEYQRSFTKNDLRNTFNESQDLMNDVLDFKQGPVSGFEAAEQSQEIKSQLLNKVDTMRDRLNESAQKIHSMFGQNSEEAQALSSLQNGVNSLRQLLETSDQQEIQRLREQIQNDFKTAEDQLERLRISNPEQEWDRLLKLARDQNQRLLKIQPLTNPTAPDSRLQAAFQNVNKILSQSHDFDDQIRLTSMGQDVGEIRNPAHAQSSGGTTAAAAPPGTG